jgi:hypothetical protein
LTRAAPPQALPNPAKLATKRMANQMFAICAAD